MTLALLRLGHDSHMGHSPAFLRLARRDGKALLWDDLAPSCRAAASEFGFMRGMWDQRDSDRGYDLVQPLLWEEWWWPWGELPLPLKLAAVDHSRV